MKSRSYTSELVFVRWVFRLGLLLVVSARKCLKCDWDHSLTTCGTEYCPGASSFCSLHVVEDIHGSKLMLGGCATFEFCKRPYAYTHDIYISHSLCNDCCFGHDQCVPHSCLSHVATFTPPEAQGTGYRLGKGLPCEMCSGGTCGIYPGGDPVVHCPDVLPYCMTVVHNKANGDKHVTKECGSEYDCQKEWWNSSQEQKNCMSFDPSNVYVSEFTCTYCCTAPYCNRELPPKDGTLFRIGIK